MGNPISQYRERPKLGHCSNGKYFWYLTYGSYPQGVVININKD